MNEGQAWACEIEDRENVNGGRMLSEITTRSNDARETHTSEIKEITEKGKKIWLWRKLIRKANKTVKMRNIENIRWYANYIHENFWGINEKDEKLFKNVVQELGTEN